MGARADSVTAIARLRRRAALVLWTEHCLRALAPACAILAAYAAAGLFGFGNGWAFVAALLLALVALGVGLARVRRPGGETIDRRIEAASGLKHRPLADLDDEPESGEATALLLWRAHQARVAARLAGSRVGAPAPLAAARDKFALRGFLLLLLVSGVVIAGPLAPSRLSSAFVLPDWPFPGPVLTVWITPPAYVQTPPLLLAAGETPQVLVGSRLTVIVSGPRTPPAALLGGSPLAYAALDDTSHRADAVVSTSGVLAVGKWWHRLGRWKINAVPPGAPVINLTGMAVSKGNTVGLHWNIADQYGLATFGAVFFPVGDAQGLRLNFSLPAGTGDGNGSIDLTDSPYAGLPVDFVLNARNLAGVAGFYDPGVKLVLPGLSLTDPTALVLAGLRQRLALAPRDGLVIANGVNRLAMAPPSQITPAADVQMAVLATALAMRQTGAEDAVARMLALEKEIEAGPDYAAQKALAASNQALTAALERGLSGKAPDEAMMRKLLDVMEQALTQHLSALQPRPSQSGGQTMDMSALERMAQKIAADEAAGRTAQAAQELQQLKQVLAALQSAKPMTAAQAAQAAAADAAAKAIAQMTKGEAALLDQTNQGTATPGEQGALQDQLNATMQSLKQAGVPVPGLGPAGRAMGTAQDALGQQDSAGAAGAENAAIAGLQQAAAALAAGQKSRHSIGQGSGEMPGQSGDEDGANGMPDEQNGPQFGYGGNNPARVIQQQIIQDDSDPALPPPVHDYYHRLLQQGQ